MLSKSAGRQRAVKMYEIDKCEICGNKATDRHHIDTDTSNNERANLLFLCRRCHMQLDGRLEKLAMNPPPTQPPKKCTVCSELSKPLRKGVCHKCNEWFRRNGKHRPKFIGKSRTLTEQKLNLILKLRKQKLSYLKIEVLVGVSATTVKKYCLENGCVFNLKYKDGKQRTQNLLLQEGKIKF